MVSINSIKALNITAVVLQTIMCIGLLVWLLLRTNDRQLPEVDLDVVTILLITFTFLTACTHLYYVFSKNYEVWISKGVNPVRWIEYSATATLMLSAIAAISGVKGVFNLTMIALASFVTMLLGLYVERTVNESKGYAYAATGAGWVLIISAFIGIFLRFHQVASSSTRKPPDFVYAILVSMFILYSTFGVIQFTRTVLPGITDNIQYNIQTELLYSIDSMISKSTLVALVFGGVVGMRTST